MWLFSRGPDMWDVLIPFFFGECISRKEFPVCDGLRGHDKHIYEAARKMASRHGARGVKFETVNSTPEEMESLISAMQRLPGNDTKKHVIIGLLLGGYFFSRRQGAAFEVLNQAAEKDSDRECILVHVFLYYCYRDGLGVPRNIERGREMIQERFADLDVSCQLAQIYLPWYAPIDAAFQQKYIEVCHEHPVLFESVYVLQTYVKQLINAWNMLCANIRAGRKTAEIDGIVLLVHLDWRNHCDELFPLYLYTDAVIARIAGATESRIQRLESVQASMFRTCCDLDPSIAEVHAANPDIAVDELWINHVSCIPGKGEAYKIAEAEFKAQNASNHV